MQVNPGIADSQDGVLIETRGLSRVYQMGEHDVYALRDVDLTIREGEFVAIIGPSGSGKSTLMYLLGCLDTPTAGTYRLGGREVSLLDDSQLSRLRNREIGFVFQHFFLLDELDITENTALGLTYSGVDPAVRKDRAQQIAHQIGIGDRLQHKPNQLSGGQLQRVAIARALAGRPRLLLADEPTGNLDSKTSREILNLLRELHRDGRTIVLVTHDPAIAAEADRTITIADGRIVKDQVRDAAPVQTAVHDPDESRGSVRWNDQLSMALQEGLAAHKLRTGLTMLGIIFGIASVIAMTAITEGGKQQQLEHLRQIGMNNVQVRDLDLTPSALLRQRRLNPRGVNSEDFDHLAQYVEGIEAATAWKELVTEIRYQDRVVQDANTFGIRGDYQSVANYYVSRGRFIDPGDGRDANRVCVLGPEIADALDLGDEPIGKVLLIGDQPFVVVGLMEQKAFTDSEVADIAVPNRNRDVYIPYAVQRLYFPKETKASELDVISFRMASEEHLVDKAGLIRHIVADLHQGAEDFGVFVPLEKLKQAQETKRVFNIIIVVIAGIALIVGGIGIMNIMLASVTERTNEIGIRRAVGASRANVMGQFLTESLLIAMFGGLLGIVVGVVGGLAIQQAFDFPVAFSVQIMIVSALVSMGVGIGFGLYPAWLAANRDPVEALRN